MRNVPIAKNLPSTVAAQNEMKLRNFDGEQSTAITTQSATRVHNSTVQFNWFNSHKSFNSVKTKEKPIGMLVERPLNTNKCIQRSQLHGEYILLTENMLFVIVAHRVYECVCFYASSGAMCLCLCLSRSVCSVLFTHMQSRVFVSTNIFHIRSHGGNQS